MKILLTGAGGFIGRRVSRKLIRGGHEVIQVVRSGSRSENSQNQEILQIDLGEPGSAERAIERKPDVVVHLAAVIPPSFVGAEADEAARSNRRMDESVFQACSALRIGVVYASSTSVYGLSKGALKSESSRACPIGPYAAAKLASEEMGKRILFHQGLSFTVLRINAPYGPGQRAQTVMSFFIESALNGLPLLYHGTGSRQQDFTYIDDIADAVVKAALRGQSGVYNVSGGHPISMKQLAELIVRCVPKSTSRVGPSGEPDSQEGVTAMYSIEKAMADLQWRPQVSLDSGVRACVRTRLEGVDENRISI